MMKKEQQSLKRPVPNTSLSSSSNSSSNPINKSSKNIEMNLDERMKRNAEKRKKRKLWKEKQRKSMEPIELFGLRYFYPYIGGKKGMKRVICENQPAGHKMASAPSFPHFTASVLPIYCGSPAEHLLWQTC